MNRGPTARIAWTLGRYLGISVGNAARESLVKHQKRLLHSHTLPKTCTEILACEWTMRPAFFLRICGERGLTGNGVPGPHALLAQREKILAANVVGKRIGGVLLWGVRNEFPISGGHPECDRTPSRSDRSAAQRTGARQRPDRHGRRECAHGRRSGREGEESRTRYGERSHVWSRFCLMTPPATTPVFARVMVKASTGQTMVNIKDL